MGPPAQGNRRSITQAECVCVCVCVCVLEGGAILPEEARKQEQGCCNL